MRASERLSFRRLQLSDDQFVFELLNDPDWIRFVGDRGIRNLEDARFFIRDANEKAHNSQIGLFAACQLDSKLPLGICSLLQRDFLTIIDIGYSFLPIGRGQGFALEAAQAMLKHCQTRLKLNKVAALTAKHNQASIKLLEKLGFNIVGCVQSSLGLSNVYVLKINTP